MRPKEKSRRVFFHHSLSQKLVSSLVTLSFVVTSVALPPSSFAETASLKQPFSVPQELGTIDESFKGAGDKTILYIQDAHDSLEAQENIAKIIQSLVKEQGIKTVFEEGYEGPVPTDEFFGSIQEAEVKGKVSYFLLDQLRIGAAEYAHINRKDDFKLIGADSSKLHLENIAWAQKNSKVKVDTAKDIAELSKHINKLASQYFPREMKDWMKLRERFDSKQLSLLDYLKRLMGLGTVFLKGPEYGDSGTSSDIASSVGTVPGLSTVPEYPNISLLLASETSKDPALLEKVKAIDAKTLFAELTNAEDDLAKRYLKDERSEKIFHYHNLLSLISRLNRLEVTPDEYEVSKSSLKDLDTSKLAEFIVKETRKSLVLSTRWEKNIQNAVGFYETAKARDTSIEGALKSFKSNPNERTAILVFGGFHKAGVKEILKKEGFSYTIIAPRISKEDPRHKASYQELMSAGYHPYELPNTIARSSRPESIFQLALTLGKTPVLDYIGQLADYVKAKGAGLTEAVLSRTLTKTVAPRFALALAAAGGATFAPGALRAGETAQPEVVPAVSRAEETPLLTGSSDYFHFGFDPAQFYVTVKDASGSKVQKTLKEAILTGSLEQFRLRLRFKGPAVIFRSNGERAYVTKRYRGSYLITAKNIFDEFPTELLLPERLRKDIEGTTLDLDKGLELEVTRGKTVLGTVFIEPMAGSSAEAPAPSQTAAGQSLGKAREEALRKPLMTLMLGAILGLSGLTPAFAIGKVQEAPIAPQEIMKGKAPQDPIQKLVSQLISTDAKKIEIAKNELIKIGKPAISTLVQEIIGLQTTMYETRTDWDYRTRIYPLESAVNGFDAIVEILKAINDPSLSSALIEISNVNSLKALVAIEGKDIARSLLIKATKNKDPRIRSWALDGLDDRVGAESSTVIPLAVEALQDSDPRVRYSAVDRLGASRDTLVIPALAEALKDSDPKVRKHAVWGLRGFEIPDPLISTLIGMLQDDNTEVRKEVVFRLGRSKSPLALNAVMEAWKDRDAEVRRAVVYVLGETMERDGALAPSLVPFLIEAAKDRRDKNLDFSSHKFAVGALVRLKERSAVPTLIEALDYRTGSDLLWVIYGLGQIGDPQAIPALTEILKNKDRQGRGPAASTLARLAGRSAIPLLLDALKDENPNVRMGAVNGLNILRDPATIPALANMLNDKDNNVKHLAVSVLTEIGTPEANAILSEHASHSFVTPSRQPKRADAGQKASWWASPLWAGAALFFGAFSLLNWIATLILKFGRKGAMSAQPYLRMLLKWPGATRFNTYIKLDAIEILGNYGSRATSETILALQNAAENPKFLEAAERALQKIVPGPVSGEISGKSLGKAREEALTKEGLERRGFLGTMAKLAAAFAVGSFGGVGCDISAPEKEEGPPFVAAVAPSATGTVSSLPLNSAGRQAVPSVIQDSANSATRLTGDVSTIPAFGQTGVRLDYNVTGTRDLIFSGFGYVADDFQTPLPDTLDLSGIPILTIAVRGNGPTFSPNAMFEIQDTAGRKAIYSLEQISGSFGFYNLDLSLTRVFGVDLTQIATLSLIEDPKSAGASPVGSYTLLLGNTDTQYLPLATITGQPAGTLTDYPLNNEATPKQADVQVAISGGNSASQVPDISAIAQLGVQGRLWNYNLPVFAPNVTPVGYAAMIYTLDNWGTGPIEIGDFSGLTELTFAVRGASAPHHTQMFFEIVDQAGNKARFLLDGITDTFQRFTIPLASLPLDITKIKETTFFVDPSIVSAAVPSGSFVVVAKNISGASLGAQKVFELTSVLKKEEAMDLIKQKVIKEGVTVYGTMDGMRLTARVVNSKDLPTLESLKQELESKNLARDVTGKSLGTVVPTERLNPSQGLMRYVQAGLLALSPFLFFELPIKAGETIPVSQRAVDQGVVDKIQAAVNSGALVTSIPRLVKAGAQAPILNFDNDSTLRVDLSAFEYEIKAGTETFTGVTAETLNAALPNAVLILRSANDTFNAFQYIPISTSAISKIQNVPYSPKDKAKLKAPATVEIFASMDIDGAGKIPGPILGKGPAASDLEIKIATVQIGTPGALAGQYGVILTKPMQTGVPADSSKVRLTVDVSGINLEQFPITTRAEFLVVQAQASTRRIVTPDKKRIAPLAPPKTDKTRRRLIKKVQLLFPGIDPAEVKDGKLTVDVEFKDLMTALYGDNARNIGPTSPAVFYIHAGIDRKTKKPNDLLSGYDGGDLSGPIVKSVKRLKGNTNRVVFGGLTVEAPSMDLVDASDEAVTTAKNELGSLFNWGAFGVDMTARPIASAETLTDTDGKVVRGIETPIDDFGNKKGLFIFADDPNTGDRIEVGNLLQANNSGFVFAAQFVPQDAGVTEGIVLRFDIKDFAGKQIYYKTAIAPNTLRRLKANYIPDLLAKAGVNLEQGNSVAFSVTDEKGKPIPGKLTVFAPGITDRLNRFDLAETTDPLTDAKNYNGEAFTWGSAARRPLIAGETSSKPLVTDELYQGQRAVELDLDHTGLTAALTLNADNFTTSKTAETADLTDPAQTSDPNAYVIGVKAMPRDPEVQTVVFKLELEESKDKHVVYQSQPMPANQFKSFKGAFGPDVLAKILQEANIRQNSSLSITMGVLDERGSFIQIPGKLRAAAPSDLQGLEAGSAIGIESGIVDLTPLAPKSAQPLTISGEGATVGDLSAKLYSPDQGFYVESALSVIGERQFAGLGASFINGGINLSDFTGDLRLGIASDIAGNAKLEIRMDQGIFLRTVQLTPGFQTLVIPRTSLEVLGSKMLNVSIVYEGQNGVTLQGNLRLLLAAPGFTSDIPAELVTAAEAGTLNRIPLSQTGERPATPPTPFGLASPSISSDLKLLNLDSYDVLAVNSFSGLVLVYPDPFLTNDIPYYSWKLDQLTGVDQLFVEFKDGNGQVILKQRYRVTAGKDRIVFPTFKSFNIPAGTEIAIGVTHQEGKVNKGNLQIETQAYVTIAADDHPTIQAAVDSAQPGDVVVLGAKTYNEQVVLKKGVTLQGQGPDKTILDLTGLLTAGPNSTGIDMATNSALNGVKIINNTFIPITGGIEIIRIQSASNVTIENTDVLHAGPVHVTDSMNVKVENSFIDGYPHSAFFAANSKVNFLNTTLLNRAGGAVIASADGSIVSLNHVTAVLNTGIAGSVVLTATRGGQFNITNSIIHSTLEGVVTDGTGSAAINNTDIVAPSGTTSGNVTLGAGVQQNVDPQFTNYPSYDFTLQPTSPLKGAATDGSDLGSSVTKARSLGAANDVAQNFAVAERLDELKANTTLYVDFRNIKTKQMNEVQLMELFGFALRNPEKVKLVIHNAEIGDEALEFFRDVKNKEIVAGDINKAFAQFGAIGTNIQLSKEGVDPAKDFTADRTKMKFFRYQAEEVGLVAVALLYSELDKIQQKLAGLEEKGGYFYVVGQILQGLVQAYEAQLVVKRAA